MLISRPRTRHLWIGAMLAALASIGAIAGCNRSHGHWRHDGHHAMHEGQTPEAARELLQSRLKWALKALDADEAQKEKIHAIGDSAVTQLHPLIRLHHDHRNDLIDALTADEIDRDELDRLRRAELEIAETASRRAIEALTDIAEVLNLEQRAQLREHMSKQSHSSRAAHL
ncbi:MAG: periplasmic heavy metal sensor [Gemmatimonadetes bacterium]|jgi:Spy/CpxP family protein refolding chaperone|nr:periplasmic heavy metal sensor [Gemmatimonadota bacterium]MBT6144283.1 periplasmic heavy metal sensor [Gemmatimonadota bacterium]MBT7859366.1 periplasmic heavy metal sensor [Gemmatimonadota bacterium]